jgi:hypothetical protein
MVIKMATTKCKMIFIDGKPAPKLCECGAYQTIGGNKANVASYFLDKTHGEWVCCGCGMTIPLK